MARLIVLGATGRLGRVVLRQALAAGHEVAAVVRDPAALQPAPGTISVHVHDLRDPIPPEMIRGFDALINCAGHVGDEQRFVDLVDRIVTSLERLPANEQPVSWFLAGAALLDIDRSGRRGVDIAPIASTYWPHRANFERLNRSALADWRLLCPGPMVDAAPLGVERLRISVDRLPVEPAVAIGAVPETQLVAAIASLTPQMSVPYADAAAFMLANLERASAMARHRFGLALPDGRPVPSHHHMELAST
ncbi:MAG: NAD(P)-dependent oxidoreductase [Gemmatimonadales bacterium]